MAGTDLVDRLAEHRTLGPAPRSELAWLAAHGTLRHLAEGEVLSAKGVPVSGFFVVLTGRIAIVVDRGVGRHKAMEWRAGDVTGMLPYSRLVSPPGDSTAQEPTEIFAVALSELEPMIRECHEMTTILVHTMLDRSRVFTSSGLHDEKMVSLGKLSAGLAHELNNPASAIERSAVLLDRRLQDAEEATREMCSAHLTDSQLAVIETLRVSCVATRVHGVLSPIEQAEREELIADWLADHGVDTEVSGSLADTSVTLEALDRVAAAVTGAPLSAVLRWSAAACSVRGIASEIQDAATRISGLVTAIKGFTHMDQASVAEPVDLESGLGNTVAVLKSKARSKSVAVTVHVDPGLPRIHGFVGELNQIWANLIDNALDAVPDGGRVDITATCEQKHIVVRVIDNGPGIPAGVREHLFEPFFTTKPVGKGTGLGLDIVRRLVSHNDGTIDFDTVPGRTEFRVSFPILASETAAGRV